jgi:hypothetical protein
MAKGRPTKSNIRQHIIDLLFAYGKSTGYDLTKKYMAHFPKCTQRVIYYHLQKGISTGEFVIESVQKETGEFSWGTTVQKVYYVLGPNAKPNKLPQVDAAA